MFPWDLAGPGSPCRPSGQIQHGPELPQHVSQCLEEVAGTFPAGNLAATQGRMNEWL